MFLATLVDIVCSASMVIIANGSGSVNIALLNNESQATILTMILNLVLYVINCVGAVGAGELLS